MPVKIVIRGGGDLASGAAARLFRAGIIPLITELPQPLVVRRLVAFGEAVYAGEVSVEGIIARRVESLSEAEKMIFSGIIPVLIDPEMKLLQSAQPLVLLDARMTKKTPDLGIEAAQLVIGLGPGFVAGDNCHAVVETQRGHNLGRVIWQGAAQADTGIPEARGKFASERVLFAPKDGELITHAEICEPLQEGDLIAEVQGEKVFAPFEGALRGLARAGLMVKKGMKIGDLDPPNMETNCRTISDKALAVGGAVLEAVLSQAEIRNKIYS